MKLKAHHDLDIGNHALFAALTDATRWERAAMRKGVEVLRIDGGDELAAGAVWQVTGLVRGKLRSGQLKLRMVEEPSHLLFDFESPMFTGVFVTRLFEMSARRTRVALEVEVRPRTLAARIVLQGARLGRQKLEGRFHARAGVVLRDLVGQLRGG
ncbi:hypothetical protein [Neogemmobacter tilapiae]|uniref:SRPBCC family protein n=1 Tax=Neogemmobacter tilapiae TaxID=875041 RepID=A0A918TUA5_9RHOB|nr:hypothetical protein [Gemmobacter tilapiae]GHC63688.1 hypothetical protein GCM10007315_30070 [Gemmobacter tilapiae]